MKFSEMKYERLDIEQVSKKLTELTENFKQAKDYQEARKAFIDLDKEQRHIQTMMTLCMIRHSIDTNDKFYNEENDFVNNNAPVLQEYFNNFNEVLVASPYCQEIGEEFGESFIINTKLALKCFKPEIIPMLQEENKVADEYEVLLASAKIPFQGEEYTLSQLTPFKSSADDEVREAAWMAEGKWYKDNQEKLDELYDKLVHLRDQMGKELGNESYVGLGYNRMNRNCYDRKDLDKFREAVRKYIVPIADDIYRKQAARIGKPYPLSYADAALSFRSGNPKPVGTPEEILQAGKKFYDELSPETSAFFNMMLDNELLDVLSTKGKQAGGYCTGIPDYEVPFIFANFNGTQGDVEVVTHEAGHAFECYTNRDRIPLDCIWPSMEACEVHSMSMEFFAWPWVENFFGNDSRKYLYSHLAGALTFIPYGTLVDDFQHYVYDNPNATPKQRHEKWAELTHVYMPWIALDGKIPFYSEGCAWQRQHHIYSSPFYYIDYCLAQTVSLEFWAMIQDDLKNAWKHYMDYTVQGGSNVFTKLLENAGLESPFESSCLEKVSKKAKQWLDNFDLTGIK